MEVEQQQVNLAKRERQAAQAADDFLAELEAEEKEEKEKKKATKSIFVLQEAGKRVGEM